MSQLEQAANALWRCDEHDAEAGALRISVPAGGGDRRAHAARRGGWDRV